MHSYDSNRRASAGSSAGSSRQTWSGAAARPRCAAGAAAGRSTANSAPTTTRPAAAPWQRQCAVPATSPKGVLGRLAAERLQLVRQRRGGRQLGDLDGVLGWRRRAGPMAMMPTTAGSIRSRPSLLSSFLLPLASSETASSEAAHVRTGFSSSTGCAVEDRPAPAATGARALPGCRKPSTPSAISFRGDAIMYLRGRGNSP